MIPRSEFENILRTHGHSVIVQRRRDESESGPYLEVAGGRYEPTAEKWTAWRRFPGSPSIEDTPMGLVDGKEVLFYLQSECAPKKGDLISEETPHERINRQTYRVEHAVPHYDGNSLIFFIAHCKLLDPVS
jgi:hypothetical protein